MSVPALSSGSLPLLGPSRSALFTKRLASRLRGTSPLTPSRTTVRSTWGTLAWSGNRSPWVIVSVTPCREGYVPVRKVARLGEHMAVAVKARVKLIPVRRSSVSFGISCASQAGSSGQCWGARC